MQKNWHINDADSRRRKDKRKKNGQNWLKDLNEHDKGDINIPCILRHINN